MKRILFFLMLAVLVLTAVSGFAEAGEDEDEARLHVVAAIILVVLCAAHLWINRKAVWRYIRGKQ